MGQSNAGMESEYRKALDLASAGQWEEAHRIVQVHDDALACLIHGYLHRVEGDLSNAAYWYRRVGEALPDNALSAELTRLYGKL